MTRILTATDGSADAGRAVDYAAGLAKRLGAELLIVNVIGGYGLPDEIFKRFTLAQAAWLDQLLEAHSSEILKAARDRALGLGAGPVRIESGKGGVVDTLLTLAGDRGIEAIVVGRRGASGVASLRLGSTAHKLVSLSPRPVIVVP